MGQARQRKAALGPLYGTPAGSNRPAIEAPRLQSPAAAFAALGFCGIASELAGADCCDLAGTVQIRCPELLCQVGLLVLRGRSYLPGHNGRICWDSPFQGHCWLVDKQGTIIDPSLHQTIATIGATPHSELKVLRPYDHLQARLLPVPPTNAARQEASRLVGGLIDHDPQNAIAEGADLLYVPGALDHRYMHKLSDGDGVWEVMAAWTQKAGGFDMAQLDRWTKTLTDEDLLRLRIKRSDPIEQNLVCLVRIAA